MRNYLYIVSFLCCLQGLLFGQTSLGYNLNEGEIFIIEQEAEQQIIQSLEGTSHELTNRISGVLHFRVLKAEDTGYLLEFMFKDLDFQIESSLQGMLLDIHAAEPDPADTQSQVFNAMLNVPVEMKLGRHGKILEVIGGDSLVSTMVKQAGLADEFNKTLMRKSLEREFGSRALAQSWPPASPTGSAMRPTGVLWTSWPPQVCVWPMSHLRSRISEASRWQVRPG